MAWGKATSEHLQVPGKRGDVVQQEKARGIWLTSICIRAFVTFGDINEKRGKEIEAELSP
jgi:hypothetical protein